MIFETMLAIDGRIVQLEEHFERLRTSALALGLPPPDESAFRSGAAGSHPVGPVRRAKSPSFQIALRCVYDGAFSFSSGQIPARTLRRRKGARVVTLDRSIVREQPEHKLTSYAEWLRDQTIEADEALFIDRRGRVLEGLTTNVFATDGSTLITARDRVLPGIVRSWVLANARRAGLRVIERRPTIDELRGGSFLTSSLTLLAPIVTINTLACTRPGPAFATLRRLYRAEIARASRAVSRGTP